MSVSAGRGKGLVAWKQRDMEEMRGRMRALALKGATAEEIEETAKRGRERYGPFAPYPVKMSPRDVKFKTRDELPRIAGVGDVDREQRLEALRRLSLHVTGEEPITEFAELDAVSRVLMQVPRAHAVAFHKAICDRFAEWITYVPCGRGTLGAQRKAYMKSLQFLRVMRP